MAADLKEPGPSSPSSASRPTGRKPRVAVVFGGRSGEHTISCATAAGVLSAIDRDRYEVLPIGITLSGQWVLVDDDPAALALDASQVRARIAALHNRRMAED